MRIVGIIQARNGSKRLPRKSIFPLAGRPLLQRYIERVKRSKMLDEVVLATTKGGEDRILCRIAAKQGIRFFRGAKHDLIGRIYRCALKHKADVIVRLCADNPLVEAVEIGRIVEYALDEMNKSRDNRFYLYSNTHNIHGNGYPDGLGVEVYHMDMFERMFDTLNEFAFREHPHMYAYDRNRVRTIQCPDDIAGHANKKLDVDTIDDYNYVNRIYNMFGHNDFHFKDYVEV